MIKPKETKPLADNELRDAANVIADAVSAAKDEKIAEAERAREQAEHAAKESRVKLNLALRTARRLNQAIAQAGEAFEETMRRALDGK